MASPSPNSAVPGIRCDQNGSGCGAVPSHRMPAAAATGAATRSARVPNRAARRPNRSAPASITAAVGRTATADHVAE